MSRIFDNLERKKVEKCRGGEGVYILPSNVRVANVGSCDLGLGLE